MTVTTAAPAPTEEAEPVEQGRTLTVVQALHAVFADVGAIEKSQRNQHFDFQFRGIDQVFNALHPILAKHSVFFYPEVVGKEVSVSGKNRHVEMDVKYHFVGPGGDELVVGPVPGEAADHADKAGPKALQAALKYLIFQMMCVPTEDAADADADAGEFDHSQRARPELAASEPVLTAKQADAKMWLDKLKDATPEQLAAVQAWWPEGMPRKVAAMTEDQAQQVTVQISATLGEVPF